MPRSERDRQHAAEAWLLEAAELRDAQLRKIRHALAKIDEGSYGACEECALPVGFSRLQARPEARLCINCQTRAERRQGA